MRQRTRDGKRQYEQDATFRGQHPTQLHSCSHRVQSNIHPARTTLYLQISRTNRSPQYTLGMQLVMKGLVDVLVAMFVVGGVGSSFVIVISFVEDMHELFTKDE